jgi:hypothetical protein
MMNNDNRQAGNPDLSTAYRTLANERTPPALDRAVLSLAEQEARGPAGSDRLNRWYRPAVFVATVGLSFALILELSETSQPGLPDSGIDSSINGVAPVGESPFQGAADATAQQVRQLEIDANSSMSEPPPSLNESAMPANSSWSDTGSLLPATDSCSDEQRASTASWWACIEKLEKQGLTQAAERELQTLLRDFPGFSLPE